MAKNDKMEAQKEAKLKALDDAIAHIEKQYGKGSVMKLGDPSVHMNVETVPTRMSESGYRTGTRWCAERTYH